MKKILNNLIYAQKKQTYNQKIKLYKAQKYTNEKRTKDKSIQKNKRNFKTKDKTFFSQVHDEKWKRPIFEIKLLSFTSLIGFFIFFDQKSVWSKKGNFFVKPYAMVKKKEIFFVKLILGEIKGELFVNYFGKGIFL